MMTRHFRAVKIQYRGSENPEIVTKNTNFTIYLSNVIIVFILCL